MKKICVITTSLGEGGAERSSAILTQLLSCIPYDVHVLMTKDKIDYEFSGRLFNLEKEFGKNLSHLKKIRILRAYFKKQSFDVIIDNRTRVSFFKEFMLYNYVFKAKKMISVVRSFHLSYYFPKNKFLTRLIYRNNFATVAVSEDIEKAIFKNFGLKNVRQIYNPIDVNIINHKADKTIDVDGEYILWYGRVQESVKNLKLLLEAYKKSILPNKDIKLYIIGQGDDVDVLIDRIGHLGLKDKVKYMPFLKNPFPYVRRAKFTALTSYHEGLPRILLESLACGTPVISVNCKSGPSEIIQHNYNGLLVENHNINALTNAFNSFIEDKALYNNCKENARASIEKFKVINIATQWEMLIED